MIEWDEPKRAANLDKHGIDFAIAENFDWDTAVMREDTRFDYGEVRMIAIGRIARIAHTMVYTRRGPNVRVISLRPASREERSLL